MSYTTEDFKESLSRVSIAHADIARVIAAWGHGEGMGDDAGKGWSPEGVSDWEGGFLFELKDGRIAYLTGWCDFTGWGCQDGAHVAYYETAPALATLPRTSDPESRRQEVVPADWMDEAPADLNRWLAAPTE